MTMVIMLVMSVTTRVNLDNFDDAEVDDGRCNIVILMRMLLRTRTLMAMKMLMTMMMLMKMTMVMMMLMKMTMVMMMTMKMTMVLMKLWVALNI